MPPRVVLRDAAADQWLEFTDPVEIVTTTDITDVIDALRRIEARVNNEGLCAAGFVSYDAAPAFDTALHARCSSTPLLWFGVFQSPRVIDTPPDVNAQTTLEWTPDISREYFDSGIARIKRHIADGDTYQVNYTFRLTAQVRQQPWEFFCELVHAQQAGYSAFIDTGAQSICSVSPELFFTLSDTTLISRPMKGTAPRGRFSDEDRARAEWLRASEKNRAENVMIVDMIRNDIGRVAHVGTVHTQDIFRIERYPTLWQMTSTVRGETQSDVTDIMRALFPCASITGAPKARTTEIIADLESTPRGIYTGAIGFIAPQRRTQFNVAIRTVVIDNASQRAEYGVGGGITWESEAADEYDECLTKARVLTTRRQSFELLETLKWTRADGYELLDAHVARMQTSADYFEFTFNNAGVRTALDTCAKSIDGDSAIVRLLSARDGSARAETRPLTARAQPIRLALAAAPIHSRDIFLFHKTTTRRAYESARGNRTDVDDVLLWNERREITETTIANIVVELDGQLFTPPINCGLLAGTYRAAMLSRGEVRERVISVDDLRRAAAMWVVNSVRGMERAVLVNKHDGETGL